MPSTSRCRRATSPPTSELAKADPEWFGISVATTDGHVYEMAIPANSSPSSRSPNPCLRPRLRRLRARRGARENRGGTDGDASTRSVWRWYRLAAQPNDQCRCDCRASCVRIQRRTSSSACRTAFSTYAGRSLTLDAPFRVERETGHRNRAIVTCCATSTSSPAIRTRTESLFPTCSIAVDCRDLAVMAATLANVRHPVRRASGTARARRQHFERDDDLRMYDYAGEWVYWVGLPAKSGVAGGVLAVLPGQLGSVLFPRLDRRGNSVRGVACVRSCRGPSTCTSCAPRARQLGDPRTTHVVVSAPSAGAVKRDRSRFRRRACASYDLQGDLPFAAVENSCERSSCQPATGLRGHRPESRRSHRRMRATLLESSLSSSAHTRNNSFW